MLIKSGTYIPRRLILWDDRAKIGPDPNNVVGYSSERLCKVCIESHRGVRPAEHCKECTGGLYGEGKHS